MKTKPTDPTASYAQEIARLITCGKLPSLEQVEAALASTREEFRERILAARKEQGQ